MKLRGILFFPSGILRPQAVEYFLTKRPKLDSVYYHHKQARTWVARPECRIKLHVIPPIPYFDPVDGLGASCKQITVPNKCYDRFPNFKFYLLAGGAVWGNWSPIAGWEIPLTKLRFSAHQSNDKLYDSLQRLRKVEVTITYIDDGEKRIILTGLFDFFDISAKELERRATLRFGLPRMLAPLLARSDRWGRIKADVGCSMSSRYAISLYEALRLRANLDRCIEEFPIKKFRDMLGVPPGAYANLACPRNSQLSREQVR